MALSCSILKEFRVKIQLKRRIFTASCCREIAVNSGSPEIWRTGTDIAKDCWTNQTPNWLSVPLTRTSVHTGCQFHSVKQQDQGRYFLVSRNRLQWGFTSTFKFNTRGMQSGVFIKRGASCQQTSGDIGCCPQSKGQKSLHKDLTKSMIPGPIKAKTTLASDA